MMDAEITSLSMHAVRQLDRIDGVAGFSEAEDCNTD
jgi:hypothetical protein